MITRFARRIRSLDLARLINRAWFGLGLPDIMWTDFPAETTYPVPRPTPFAPANIAAIARQEEM